MRNWAENQIKLILIRHGETPSNGLGRYLGKTEENLSKVGIEKILKAKSEGKYPAADICFSSPMRRCIETARLIYDCCTPITIEEWREIDFGRFEGKNYQELNGDREYQAWIDSSGTLPFPEGESREDFLVRCLNGMYLMIDKLINRIADTPLTVAAIVHGGTIMSILSTYGKDNYFDYQCKNAEGYECNLIVSMDQGLLQNIKIDILGKL